MHQDPEHEDYDDDDYKHYPEYNEYGYPYSSKKFDVDWSAWEQWLSKALFDISEESENVWIFGHKLTTPKKQSQPNNSGKDKYFLYLGSNQYNEAIWKQTYLVKKPLQTAYNNHIASHAVHFLRQPSYYKGMFDILN